MKHVIAILMIITSADMAVHTAEAQTRTSITGTVTDPNGAVVAGAAIALRPADGTPPLRTTSDGSGQYRFEDAGPGPFTLEVDASGFRHFSRELRASTIGGENENVTLELAGLNESLLVTTATRSPLEIDKSPVSTSLVTRQEIETRNIHQVDQALLLTEGVNGSRAKGPADNDFGIGLRGFSAMGGSYRTLILLDGQPLNNSFIGSSV